MKKKLKIIIPTFVVVILITAIVILNIPYNLNKALRFDGSEQLIMSVSTMKNINGQPESNGEQFTFKKGSVEFTAIINLLDGYSYNLTTAKAIREASHDVTMIDIYGNNSGVYLSNFAGSNIIVNGKNYRMKQNKVEELLDKILAICGME